MPETTATSYPLAGRRRGGATRSQRVRALLGLGIVLGLGATSTMALWSDSATATSGAFTTGTVDIRLGNPAVNNDPAQFTTDFALANMAPGATKDATLRLSNAGTLPFGYTLSGAATGELGAALQISVYPAATCTAAPLVAGVPATGQILPAQPALAAAATRALCLRATLPTNAPTSLQGQSTSVTLTFTATNT